MVERADISRTPECGLSSDAVAALLAEEGYNELPQQEKRTLLAIVIDVLKEPMLALLLAGGVVYLLIGEPFDAALLLGFACLSIGMTIVQEARSEKVLDALKTLTSPRALVIRDGETVRIAGARGGARRSGASGRGRPRAGRCPPDPRRRPFDR